MNVGSRVLVKSYFSGNDKKIKAMVKDWAQNNSLVLSGCYLPIKHPVIMIVEGLYYKSSGGVRNVDLSSQKVTPVLVKCIWYDNNKVMQEKLINIKLLLEV